MDRPTNATVAAALERTSELLEAQGASQYRVQAYREAGAAVRKGEPNVSPPMGAVVREVLETGHLGFLERLEGEVSPEDVFMTVPGMGEALARRAHTMLRLETLEDLEAAAMDGRLERLPGFGPRRALLVRDAVTRRLAGSRRRWSGHPSPDRPDPFPAPPVELLLAIDGEYRHRATAGDLQKIRPRRFNPANEAYLPVWHTDRDGWAFTAMFSNTARALDLGMAGTWVSIFFEREGYEGQATVVTASRGLLAGLRVVRGREGQCQAHYDALHRAAEPRHVLPLAAVAAAQQEIHL